MRIPFLLGLILLLLAACSSKRLDTAKAATPFPIQIERFDSAFFSIDTMHIAQSVDSLLARYPHFTNAFLTQILMLPSVKDTQSIKAFYNIYWPVYVAAKNANAIKIAQPLLEEGFKRIHFYFPNYVLTHKLVLFVGPFEQFGNIVTKDALAIGLQMHLGEGAHWYASEQMQTIYPAYIRAKFTPIYIAVNSVENIVNDISPLRNSGDLITQIVEAGKRRYVLNACLPSLPDSVIMGYSAKELKQLQLTESKIWEYVLAENLVFSNNEYAINSFMLDGQDNDIFGEGIPGNIGKYIGYQIVDAWMQQKAQSKVSIEKLLATPAHEIFNGAHYKP